jgi:hypothetical protein
MDPATSFRLISSSLMIGHQFSASTLRSAPRASVVRVEKLQTQGRQFETPPPDRPMRERIELADNISRYAPRREQPIPTRAGRRRQPHRGKKSGCRALLACDCPHSRYLRCSLRREDLAYVNYPWCIIGDDRGIDCVFSEP